jgi:hypothetical protein
MSRDSRSSCPFATLEFNEQGVSSQGAGYSCYRKFESFELKWAEIEWTCSEKAMVAQFFFGTKRGTFGVETYNRLGSLKRSKLIGIISDVIQSVGLSEREDCGHVYVNEAPLRY